MLNRMYVVFCLAVVVLFAAPVSAQGAVGLNHPSSGRPKEQLVGTGKWQSRRIGNDTQDWQIQVQRMDDDSLSGRITIVGSPLIQQARIEGQIFGSEVDGVVVGDDGVQVATFTGSIAKRGPSTGLRTGMSGTYTTTDGDSGNWSWDGGGSASLSDRASESLGNNQGIESSGDRAIGSLGKGAVDGPAVSDQPPTSDQSAAAAEIQALGLVAPGE